MYAVFGGKYFSEGGFIAVFDKKKEAIAAIRALGGFKHDRESNIFENNHISEWYSIEPCLHNKLEE